MESAVVSVMALATVFVGILIVGFLCWQREELRATENQDESAYWEE